MLNVVVVILVCALLYVVYRLNSLESEVQYLASSHEWSEPPPPLVLPSDLDDVLAAAPEAPLPATPAPTATPPPPATPPPARPTPPDDETIDVRLDEEEEEDDDEEEEPPSPPPKVEKPPEKPPEKVRRRRKVDA